MKKKQTNCTRVLPVQSNLLLGCFPFSSAAGIKHLYRKLVNKKEDAEPMRDVNLQSIDRKISALERVATVSAVGSDWYRDVTFSQCRASLLRQLNA